MDDRRVIWAIVALHVAAGVYGFMLNDEADQATAFYNLAHGSLLVKDVPPGTSQLHNNISWQRRWDDDRPIASTPLNILALPVLFALHLADAVAPLSLWFSGIAVYAIWRAAGRSAPWTKPPGALGAAVLLGGLLVLGQGMRTLGPDLDYYGATAALNVTGIILGIVGSALAWHALGKHASAGWRPILLCALVFGSWLFWARLPKYHMLGAVNMLCIIALLQRPRTVKRDVLVGLLAGLAVWVNFGIGIVAILGLVSLKVAELIRSPGARQAALRTWGPLLVGGLLGLTPAMAENTYLFGNPFINFYFASPETSTVGGHSSFTENATSEPEGNIVWATLKQIPAIFSHLMHWNGPQDFFLNLGSTFTTGTRLEGGPSGIFLISPLLALSLLGVYRLFKGPSRPVDCVWALGVLAWQALLGTNAGALQGAGFDARLWFHILPLLALLAAFGIQGFHQETRARKIIAGAFVFSTGVFLFLWCLANLGYRLGTPASLARLVLLGTLLLGALATALVFSVSIMRRSPKAPSRARAVALTSALAVSLVWTGLFTIAAHPSLPDSGSHEGATTFVPFMDATSTWIHDAISPPTLAPLAWNETGVLVFHPDHGSCLVVPNPCPDVPMPDALRQRLENTTRQTTGSSAPH